MEEVVNIITTFISNCGFPIFACVMMFLQNSKMKSALDENTKAINELKQSLVERG